MWNIGGMTLIRENRMRQSHFVHDKWRRSCKPCKQIRPLEKENVKAMVVTGQQNAVIIEDLK
jgi:hypothetical protein